VHDVAQGAVAVRIPGGRALLGAGSIALLAAYPFGVYFLMGRGNIRVAGLALVAVLAIRLLTPGAPRVQAFAALVAGGVFAVAIVATNSETLARLYPVAVSATMLAAFGWTLVRPPSMVGRIARATGAVLDAAGVRYTRNVTVVWCAYFLANGAIALTTALAGSREVWALYNGLLSYLIAGALLLGERLVRERLRRRALSAAGQ
jgi:uncharacterized membrane protein